MSEVTLFGSPLSLYSGKARSYLIKSHTLYKERVPNDEYFDLEILPKMGGRRSIPVVRTDSGEVIRDGKAILDHFEALNGQHFSPRTGKQLIVSQLFDVIGMEGLLRPAMHYRWNFDEVNAEFIKWHFATLMPPNINREKLAEKRMAQMREAGRSFGVTPDTFSVIESLYLRLLDKLNEHFSRHSYLLGNKPCIGDFGMIAPLYGHLGRDPKPLSLMQNRAICVFRWVERMNRPNADVGEFPIAASDYLEDDCVPDTIVQLLRQIAIDFIPESRAARTTINAWLSQQKDMDVNTPVERGVGMCTFEVEGTTITSLAQPYRFYLFNRIHEQYASLSESEREEVDSLLDSCGMSEIMHFKLSREIGRKDNREVWL